MTVRHKEISVEALNLVAARFKVLAEALRLRILNTLQSGERSVSEITKAVGSTQPNVSKHLRILQDAGLIGRRQEGATVYYSIADDTVFQLCDLVCSSLLDRLETQAGAFAKTAIKRQSRRRL